MEQKKKSRIAVLMTVHNRRETTLNCLHHLYALCFDNESFQLDIYLTDDGSIDGTAEAVRQNYPRVQIVDGDGTLFWNRGMLAAWQVAAKSDYDYYWWVNDDTFVFPDTLSRMLACSREKSDCAIIVGSTCSSGRNNVTTYGGMRDNRLITDLTSTQQCDTMNGNLVLIPKFVYERIGMNDPYYIHSLGDTDYGLRAKEAGIDILAIQGHCGICDLHEKPTVWMDSSQPLRKRWKNFFSPLGNNPFEFFHYRRMHYGFLPAIGTFLTNILHFIFPNLWLKRSKRKTVC